MSYIGTRGFSTSPSDNVIFMTPKKIALPRHRYLKVITLSFETGTAILRLYHNVICWSFSSTEPNSVFKRHHGTRHIHLADVESNMDVDVVDADVTSREEGECREFTTMTTKNNQQSAIALAPPTLIQQSIVAVAAADSKQKRRRRCRCRRRRWRWL
jgi:hypothetical protein